MAQSFRLATLLKLREQTRVERRRELAQAFEAERILRDRAAQMESDIELTQQRTRSAAKGSVNVETLLNARRYELTVKGQLADVQAQMYGAVLNDLDVTDARYRDTYISYRGYYGHYAAEESKDGAAPS